MKCDETKPKWAPQSLKVIILKHKEIWAEYSKQIASFLESVWLL